MSNQGWITIRGDGEELARVHVGSQAVLHKDEEWTPTETRTIRRCGTKGTWYTDTQTLRQRLDELLGERAASVWNAAKECRTVTIRDEYSY